MSSRSVLTDQQKAHLSNAMSFMIRYATTRKTSADMATVSALRSFWHEFSDTQKNNLLKEIEDNLDFNPDTDRWLWDDFFDWAEKQ